MKLAACLRAVLAALALSGCGDDASKAPATPHQLTADAVGHYCGMNVMEHPGPKGQIIVASRSEPVWFSSARDAFSFTMLAEEAKDIRAIYVSDMAKAPSWDDPGAGQLDRCPSGVLRHRQQQARWDGGSGDRAVLRSRCCREICRRAWRTCCQICGRSTRLRPGLGAHGRHAERPQDAGGPLRSP